MNRRNFLNSSFVLSSSMMVLPSSIGLFIPSFSIEKTGIKTLIKSQFLKEELITDNLKAYVDALRDSGLSAISNKTYTYRDNYIVKAESKGALFSERGLLFVIKGHSHTFVAEKYLNAFEDLIHSYVTSINQMNIKLDPTEFLFPHKVMKNNRSPFSFINKYGDHISIKKIGGKSRLIINQLNI